jgi:4-amino-4-deoxychorismate lyase
MSRFIESIQVSRGVLNNLELHQERLERTRYETLGLKKHPRLEQVIEVPGGLEQGLFKCRVTYGKDIELIEYEPYRAFKVSSLKLVHSDSIDYAYKYADRSRLQELFEQREDKDDILVVKDKCITDSFYANVLFWDGSSWLTPDTPLLPGTMRRSLLRRGIITECRITLEDLNRYQKVKLINAMNDLQSAPEISLDSIQ